jgi:hypothetical protein
MPKVRRGGYVFMTWKADHPPRHVHVFRDGRLILKWNLEAGVPLCGHSSARILALIEELDRKGRL